MTHETTTETDFARPICAQPKSLIVIPARLASTRLPEKLLLRETGKSVLQHTYESATESRLSAGVVVAVDAEVMEEEVHSFGGHAVMTGVDLASGTDRVVEVAKLYPDVDIFVNVQGDEPEIDAAAIDSVIQALSSDPSADVATLACPIRDADQLQDPACVKVVCDAQGRAMYFSRSMIPCVRDWDPSTFSPSESEFLQHIGVYAYRRQFLMRLHELPHSPLEQLEKLEQLRFLQGGYSIQVEVVQHAARGIDTQSDYDLFLKRFQRRAA